MTAASKFQRLREADQMVVQRNQNILGPSVVGPSSGDGATAGNAAGGIDPVSEPQSPAPDSGRLDTTWCSEPTDLTGSDRFAADDGNDGDFAKTL
jgi:hypothetical protein